jgi:chorismate-pyruvate lyase
VTTAPTLELLQPLPVLYEAAGRPLPEFDLIDARLLPAACHRLLVHTGDMTSKLEEFFGDEMSLRVLRCDHSEQHYRREVVLFCSKSELPVEYGAIQIELGAFEEPLRSEIIEGRLPLGGLLNRHGVRYRSQPRGFLRVSPDMRLAEIFQLPAPVALYGRTNQLLDGDGRVLARIVEVLRPVQPPTS